MNRFRNAMKVSIHRVQEAVAVARIGERYLQTPTLSGLLVNRLSKKGRNSKYFNPHRFVALTLAAAIALSVMITWKARSASADTLSCGINEITFTSGEANQEQSINGDGTLIAFASKNDLTGKNSDHNSEIFLYDTKTNSFTQITDTTLGFQGNQVPAISGDGKRIAFSSDRDLTGENSDGNLEIFFFDIVTNSFSQITKTTGTVPGLPRPELNSDGTRIAFESPQDLTGGNADGNEEVFLFDTKTSSFTQVTNTVTPGQFVGAQQPRINGDGTLITFISNQNLTGGNGDGNTEIFLFNTASNSFTQVTNTSGTGVFSRDPSISSDGTHIAFESNGFLGGNPDGNHEIFLFDVSTGGVAEITFTTGGDFANTKPFLNSDGTRIAFESTRDLTGGNADGNTEIFLFDRQSTSFTQVTNTSGQFVSADSPRINADGSRISFLSDGFFDIGNADGNFEIFLAACLVPPPPAPVTSADVVISQNADKTSVKAGDKLTYTITVKNLGPDSAIGNVINDTLSSGVTFVNAKANKGNIVAPPVGGTGTVTWNLGDLQNGDEQAAQIQVTVIVRGKTTLTNTAMVVSSTTDPNPANNSSSLTTTVQSGGKK